MTMQGEHSEAAGALEGLNPAQREAVTATEGYVRVIAGAGSGKTRALARRFAYLVNDLGIMPSHILCVTFTNKAANEMRHRIHLLTGDNDTAYVNTFHGFCVSVLQEDAHAISYPKSFLVLDNSDINAMLDIVYEERGLTLRDMTYGKARDMIEVRKTITQTSYYHDLIAASPELVQKKYLAAVDAADIIFYGYLYQEKKCFGLDYNDLIVLTLHIFDTCEDVRLKWQKRLEYVMVDEFQDIDPLQYRLMEALCAYHGNLFVVGDPDQTIYTWRGANVRFLLDFDKRFPGTRTVQMNENYRSTPQITAVANALIGKNKLRIAKDLVSQRPHGPKVACYHAEGQEDEAVWVAGQLARLHEEGAAWKDMCLLYRAHYVTRSLEDALAAHSIPYTIYSGVQFFDRAEVKDALSYLRMVAFKDDLSFARIVNAPKRNMGEKRMKFLRTFADGQQISLYQALVRSIDDPLFKGTKAREFVDLVERYGAEAGSRPVSELLSALLDESGYERALRTEGSQERLDNLAELRQSIYEYETTCGEEATLDQYLAHVSLFSNLDAGTGDDKVKLMTIHAAKGLEFRHVFVCGMDEGILPSRKTQTMEAMEEERRLAFVAFTRAQDTLALTCAEGTGHDGMPRYPSRFILDVNPALLDFTTPLSDSLVAEARKFYRYKDRLLRTEDDGPRFQIGDTVRHAVFGTGTVVAIDVDEGSYRIAFEGMDTPRTLSVRAKLEGA